MIVILLAHEWYIELPLVWHAVQYPIFYEAKNIVPFNQGWLIQWNCVGRKNKEAGSVGTPFF